MRAKAAIAYKAGVFCAQIDARALGRDFGEPEAVELLRHALADDAPKTPAEVAAANKAQAKRDRKAATRLARVKP